MANGRQYGEQKGSHQIRRILEIMRILSNQQLSSAEIKEQIDRSVEGKEVTRRQIQRDLEVLVSSCVVDFNDSHNPPVYSIFRGYRNVVPDSYTGHELLSLYVLKSALKPYKNTRLEKIVNRLLSKLEKTASGDVVSLELSHSTGQFKYNLDSTIIDEVIKRIRDSKSSNITYINCSKTEKNYDVQFGRLFHYGGELYVGAYIFKHRSYCSLAIRNLVTIKDAVEDHPQHEFDEVEFSRNRFAVYSAQSCEHVRLRIDSSVAEYFENRRWHQSECMTRVEGGDLVLEMTVPVVPDLITWVAQWAANISIESPVSLREKVVELLRKGIERNDGPEEHDGVGLGESSKHGEEQSDELKTIGNDVEANAMLKNTGLPSTRRSKRSHTTHTSGSSDASSGLMGFTLQRVPGRVRRSNANTAVIGAHSPLPAEQRDVDTSGQEKGYRLTGS